MSLKLFPTKLFYIVTAIFCGALLVASCSKTLDFEEVREQQKATSYVSFQTRAQGAAASLNQDATDFEDKVVSLRIMAFKSATGEIAFNQNFTDIANKQTYSNKFKVKPGQYDLYFVANETAEIAAALATVSNKDDLYRNTALAQVPYDYNEVNTATAAARRPFLMTAIKENVSVTVDNKFNNPSNAGTVYLVRCLAKATINIGFDPASTADQRKGMIIRKLEMLNVPNTYSLFPPQRTYQAINTFLPAPAPSALENVSEEDIDRISSKRLTKIVYVPEYLLSSTLTQDKALSFKAIYFKHGIEKDLTIPFDHLEQVSTPVLLSRNSVIRNTDYQFTLNMKGWDEELISYNWKVLPWTLVKSLKYFESIQFENNTDSPSSGNFEVENPGVSKDPDHPNILNIHSGQSDHVKLKFTLKNPPGAVWRFSIDNSLDFSLEVREDGEIVDNNTGVIMGKGADSEVEVTITALKPYNGDTRNAEFYLTIDGIEVQIVPTFQAAKEESGPTKRYMIRQVL